MSPVLVSFQSSSYCINLYCGAAEGFSLFNSYQDCLAETTVCSTSERSLLFLHKLIEINQFQSLNQTIKTF